MLVQNEMTLTENLMKYSAQFVNTRYNLTFNNVKWKVYSKSVFNQEPWLLAWHIYLSSLKKMVGYGATGGTYQEGPALFFFSNRGKGRALVLFYFFCFLSVHVRFSRNNQQNSYLTLHIVDFGYLKLLSWLVNGRIAPRHLRLPFHFVFSWNDVMEKV